MHPDHLILVRQWMLTRSDLLLAHRAAEGDPPLLDGAVYHCQQAAEKTLKAFLALHELPLPRTHNLPELLSACIEIDIEFEMLREAAITLSPYATLFRYPGELLEPPPEVAAEAIAHAHEVFTFVNVRLPVEAHLHETR